MAKMDKNNRCIFPEALADVPDLIAFLFAGRGRRRPQFRFRHRLPPPVHIVVVDVGAASRRVVEGAALQVWPPPPPSPQPQEPRAAERALVAVGDEVAGAVDSITTKPPRLKSLSCAAKERDKAKLAE
jgi:hypothetical protein